MKVDDGELVAVCLAMVTAILVPTALLIGVWPLALVAGLVLAATVHRLVRLASRPDPWRAFERALTELGVVVAAPPAADPPAQPAPRVGWAGPPTPSGPQAAGADGPGYAPTALKPPST